MECLKSIKEEDEPKGTKPRRNWRHQYLAQWGKPEAGGKKDCFNEGWGGVRSGNKLKKKHNSPRTSVANAREGGVSEYGRKKLGKAKTTRVGGR